MNTTRSFREREEFRKLRYHQADERNEKVDVGQTCILCRVRIPGGSGIASSHHEVLSKGELPGKNNWQTLFALQNIAPACPQHHQSLGHLRTLWLHAMTTAGLARIEQYQVAPFNVYWQDAPYPPCGKCMGCYGYGTQYFDSTVMPDSLARLYWLDNPGFDPKRFCEFCAVSTLCKGMHSEISPLSPKFSFPSDEDGN